MTVGIEKLIGLEPSFKTKVESIVFEMEAKGWKIRIVWGKRTHQENDELVKKGVASKTSKHLFGKTVDMIDRKVGYSENRQHQLLYRFVKFS